MTVLPILAATALAWLPQNAPTQPAAQQEIEAEELESTDEIITEEEMATEVTNWMAPPEFVEAQPTVTEAELRYASEIDLSRALSAVSAALKDCQDLRRQIEERIGDRPGSYNVHPGWPRSYAKCVTQRRADLGVVGKIIEQRRREIVASGQDEGATRLTRFIDRLGARYSQVKLDVHAEQQLINPFTRYYNTGEKAY